MRATSVHRGDLVFVSHRGRLFYAKVLGAAAVGQLQVEPLDRGVRTRAVALADVREHWARTTDSDPGESVGQIRLFDP